MIKFDFVLCFMHLIYMIDNFNSFMGTQIVSFFLVSQQGWPFFQFTSYRIAELFSNYCLIFYDGRFFVIS